MAVHSAVLISVQGTSEHRLHRPCRCWEVHNWGSNSVPHGMSPAANVQSCACLQDVHNAAYKTASCYSQLLTHLPGACLT